MQLKHCPLGKSFRLVVLTLVLLFHTSHVDAQTDAVQSAISKELENLVKSDQADQANPPQQRTKWDLLSTEEREAIIKVREEQLARDKQRRERTTEMIQRGELQSANDYFNAAQIFQHGTKAEDFLIAHVLATVAAFKGHSSGKWMSAASLDRFLIFVGRPQILGTNYHCDKDCPLQTQEPYDSSLSDVIRNEYCVPSLVQQRKNLDFFNNKIGQFRRRAEECEKDNRP